jgi:tRNA(Ile)-lysidine synthase
VSTRCDEITERVRATGLLSPGRPVIVMLSGGRDSVCLLDLAAMVRGPQGVSALHVNYGLREDAGADEALCREMCSRLGVALEVETASAPQAGNLQAWARDFRYGAGASLAAASGSDLAAGHTLSDQAETVLYRLAASPGRRALLGMPERRGRLVRPLLAAGLTREETTAWCEDRGLRWADDFTNDDGPYARTRIRREVLPGLEQVNPAAAENISRTAELLRDEAEVLDMVVETALAGRREIPLAHLEALPTALARLVVRELAESATGAPCPRAASRLDEILGLDRGAGSAALDVGDGARALVDGGVLRFGRSPERSRAGGR